MKSSFFDNDIFLISSFLHDSVHFTSWIHEGIIFNININSWLEPYFLVNSKRGYDQFLVSVLPFLQYLNFEILPAKGEYTSCP